MRTIYSKYSRERKQKYQLETKIFENNDKKYVRKSPLTLEAKEHIATMYDNSKLLNEKYSNVDILQGEIIDGNLIFPFIDGVSWDKKLFDALLQKDVTRFFQIVEEFKNLLANLQPNNIMCFHSSEEFEKVFGEKLELTNVQVLQPANIDITFDNMIVQKNGNSVMIDCEWVFSFKVPISLILFRSLYVFWVKYQSYIGPMLSLNDILYRVGINEELITKFLSMEEHSFQRFVHGEPEEKDYLVNYIKRSRSINELNTIFDNERFNLQFILIDKVSDSEEIIRTISSDCTSEFIEYKVKVGVSSNSVIRIDPTDRQALIEIKSIQILDEDNNTKKYYNKSNNYAGLTYSNNIIINSTEDCFSFIAFNNDPQIYLDFNTQGITLETFTVIVSMRVRLDSTKQYRDVFISHNNEINELKLQLELTNESHSIKEIIIQEQNDKLKHQSDKLKHQSDNLKHQSDKLSEYEVLINEKVSELEQLNELLNSRNLTISQMENSTSWRITSPMRRLGKFRKSGD